MTIVKWALALAIGGFLLMFGFTKFAGGAHIFPLIELNASGAGLPFAELAFPLGNYATILFSTLTVAVKFQTC